MLVPYGSYIFVVDGSRLALFRSVGKDYVPQLELIEQERDLVPRTSEMGSGAPGRGFQSSGNRRASYEQTDIHQALEEQFAMRACERLESLLEDGRAGVILVAPPRVLGQMRKRLAPALRQHILREIDKDYAGRTPDDLAKLLENYED